MSKRKACDASKPRKRIKLDETSINSSKHPLEYYEKLVKAEPQNHLAHIHLARAWSNEHFDFGSEGNEMTIEKLKEMKWTIEELDAFDENKEKKIKHHLQVAMALNPDCAAYHNVMANLGCDYRHEKEYLHNLERAHSLDPDNSTYLLHYCDAARGSLKLKLLKKLMILEPNNPTFCQEMYELLPPGSDDHLHYLQKYIYFGGRTFELPAYLLNLLAKVYITRGEFVNARNIYDKILLVSPSKSNSYAKFLKKQFPRDPMLPMVRNMSKIKNFFNVTEESGTDAFFDRYATLSKGYRKLLAKIYPQCIVEMNNFASGRKSGL